MNSYIIESMRKTLREEQAKKSFYHKKNKILLSLSGLFPSKHCQRQELVYAKNTKKARKKILKFIGVEWHKQEL